MTTAGVEEVADALEARFDQVGLTVTMGGEPTFIPARPEGPEWNLEALGSEKLRYARRITARLLRELYPGGLVMQASGKQYPGEPVPRWVVMTLHRDDDVPMWQHPELFLLGDAPGAQREGAARDFMAALSSELGLEGYALPCAEETASSESLEGWVLPLDFVDGSWVSDRWPFSSESPVALVPGESPLGLRLPLGAIDDRFLKRALTIEVTEGALHIFIPPLELAPFTALTRLIEGVAVAKRASNLVLCGYRPANAPSVTSLGFSADPGVLELNLPPAKTWKEYDQTLRIVTRLAEDEGLRTFRLHLNGQVQGTGGGAHVLFGGPTIEQNPFFERPDLLGSVIRYWQRHPALSYLFSGQYVGPGSQAPRADEAQPGRIYELETACLGLDAVDGVPEPAFLDRLLRNLMTDSAGNTHRAEICLDKLWNFDSPTGLQGLVELRAFATTSDVQQQSLSALFVRAVVAMLAARPCKQPLIRWGPYLHDACMLPTVLWQDLVEICDQLASVGLPFEAGWLRPLWEHRFTVLGRLRLGEDEVVVRQALDPWPLMAEQTEGSATSRVVDNSTDRIEISAASAALGLENDVSVDGIVLGLREVGDQAVGGVRYKSAAGWPALHPHLPSQSPLRIEAVDHSGRVVSSARYHFWNPDGQRYEGPPGSLKEARARRAARWQPEPSRVGERPALRPGSYFEESYFTLDLRRQ